MNDDNHPVAASLKVAFAWAAYFLGAITLQNIVLAATLVYTLVQLYILIRDKIIERPRQP